MDKQKVKITEVIDLVPDDKIRKILLENPWCTADKQTPVHNEYSETLAKAIYQLRWNYEHPDIDTLDTTAHEFHKYLFLNAENVLNDIPMWPTVEAHFGKVPVENKYAAYDIETAGLRPQIEDAQKIGRAVRMSNEDLRRYASIDILNDPFGMEADQAFNNHLSESSDETEEYVRGSNHKGLLL
jgi:hypothetical protein